MIKNKKTMNAVLLSIAILLLGISSLVLFISNKSIGAEAYFIDSDESEEIEFSLQKLDKPSIAFEGDKLVWSVTEYADNVEVFIDDVLVLANAPKTFNNTPYEFLDAAGEHKLKIRAVSTGAVYSTSDFSDEVTLYKLEAPILYLHDNLENNSQEWRFYEVQNAKNYTVTKKRLSDSYVVSDTIIKNNPGVELKISNTSITPGVWTICVSSNPVSNIDGVLYVKSDDIYLNIDGKSAIEFEKIPTPVLTLNDSVLSWESSPNVSNSYLMKNNNPPPMKIEEDVTEIDFRTLYLQPGTYSFKLISYGKEFHYLSSDYSSSINVTVTALSSPEPTFNTTTGVLSWSAVTGADSYKIRIRDKSGSLLDTISTSSLTYNLTILDLQNGDYNVTVQAVKEGAVEAYYSSNLITFYLDIDYENPVEIKFEGVEKDSITIGKGMAIIKPDDPIKDGHKFIGWYLGDELYEFGTAVTEDITLTAKFEKLSFGQRIGQFFSSTTSKVVTGVSGGLMLLVVVVVIFVIIRVKNDSKKT